jgi:asparagine N-glycosylation enzyme membrane subunit Stt3
LGNSCRSKKQSQVFFEQKNLLDFFPFWVIVKINHTVGGNSMKKKWMLVLVAVVTLVLYMGAFQHAFAAERTMVIRVPQCV